MIKHMMNDYSKMKGKVTRKVIENLDLTALSSRLLKQLLNDDKM